MAMNQFTERYKALSNKDLLGIIENQSDYQAEAIEAARDEIELRNLSPQEHSAAEHELEKEKQQEQLQKDKQAERGRKIRSVGASIIDAVHPIQKETPTTNRHITYITLVIGFISLYSWYDGYGMIRFLITSDEGGWDMSLTEYFTPLVLLPIAVVLFWLRKKSGWILLVTYFTYSFLGSFGAIISTWGMEPTGNLLLDSIFPIPPITSQIITLLFWAGALKVVIKNDIKSQFQITRNTTLITLAISCLLTIALFVRYFM